MKLVLTLNEIKSGNALLARIGIAGESLKSVIEMKSGTVIEQDKILEFFNNNVGDKLLAELNKNPKTLSVSKEINDFGTEIYTFVISEEFILDVNNLYGDLFVELASNAAYFIKSVSLFFHGSLKKFVDKWKIIN